LLAVGFLILSVGANIGFSLVRTLTGGAFDAVTQGSGQQLLFVVLMMVVAVLLGGAVDLEHASW